jgi:hypothetical protein
MDRVIKFRAWYHDKNVMEHEAVIPLEGCVSEDSYPWIGRVTIMQFIGLHDGTTWADLTEAERERWTLDGNMPSEWKGRCIYEGDVFQYTAHDGYMLESFTAEVRWIESYACFGYCKIGLTKEGWEQPLVHPFSEHDEFCIDVLPYIKVIGNIY